MTAAPDPAEVLQAGQVQWHCSEEDGGPDVGILVGLGNGVQLWLGELLNDEAGDVGFVVYRPGEERVIAALSELDEVRDVIEHHVAPALRRATEAPPVAGVGEELRIGDKVEVIGEYEADFRGEDWWVAGIRVHDSGEGLDVTLAEQWPIPNRHWREYRGQTDGFRPEQLRVIEAALTKPTPPEVAGSGKDRCKYYRHLLDEGISELTIESMVGEGWTVYQIYQAELEGGSIQPIGDDEPPALTKPTPPASVSGEEAFTVTIFASGDGENTAAEAVHHALAAAYRAGHCITWSEPVAAAPEAATPSAVECKP